MDIHLDNGKTIQVDNIQDYTRNQNPKHGKLGQIKTEDIKILEKTRTNYEDVNASVEEGKKIMYNFLINNDIATDINLPLSKYGFNCIKDILVFQHRDEKLLVNKYLFNIKTGEVYYINKILMDNININKYHEYDKIISDGIQSALQAIAEINLLISCSSDFDIIST
jgi:HD superfamily phosphodiesterase